jgi:hypothetical protein
MAVEWTDPVFLILVALVVFFVFLYLLLRRTLLSFQEGMERGKER